MVNGIDSSSSYLTYLQTHPTKHKTSAAEMFNKVDTDGSGGISASELETLAQKISKDTGQTINTKNAITTYDTDGNGELSSEEMSAFMQATMQQGMGMMGMHGGPGKGGDLFTALDSDGSGGVSQSELDTWATNMSSETGMTLDTSKAISTYDTDGNGELSDTELKSFLDASGIKPPTSQASLNSSASTDLFNAITGGSSQMTQSQLDTWATNMSKATGKTLDTTNAISTYDTDNDGTLSATEFSSFLDANGISAPQTAGMAPPPPPPSETSETTSSTSSATSVLSKYDTNGDGVLSTSELQAYLDDIASTNSKTSTDSSSSASLNSFVAKALSAYASNQATSLQNLFQSLTGSTEDYTSISYSV
jgi:Ca2+-binding EF-hand superfamily protein